MSRSDRRPKAAEEARSGVTRRRGEPKVMTTLRLRRCPGIYFADEPSGRTAKVGGTGLGVWEVLRDFCQGDDLEALRQTFPDLSQAQLTARQASIPTGFGVWWCTFAARLRCRPPKARAGLPHWRDPRSRAGRRRPRASAEVVRVEGNRIVVRRARDRREQE